MIDSESLVIPPTQSHAVDIIPNSSTEPKEVELRLVYLSFTRLWRIVMIANACNDFASNSDNVLLFILSYLPNVYFIHGGFIQDLHSKTCAILKLILLLSVANSLLGFIGSNLEACAADACDEVNDIHFGFLAVCVCLGHGRILADDFRKGKGLFVFLGLKLKMSL